MKLMKFSASWCGPCKMLSKVMDGVDLGDVQLMNIDIDENSDLAVQYGIRGVPTMVLLDADDKEIGRLGWGGSTPSIIDFWKRYTQVYPDIQIETCDGHVVDLATWNLEQHYKYFSI